MFDLNSDSTWIWLFAILGCGALIAIFKWRVLPSPQKELRFLGLALLFTGALGWMVTTNLYFPAVYGDVPEHITTLDEAQKVLQRQHEDLKSLSESLQRFGKTLYLFLVVGIVWTFSSIYQFAKAMAKPEDGPGPHSHENAKREPIFNLDED
jgi:hypothetical protein